MIDFGCGFEKEMVLLKDAEKVEHCVCKIEVFGPDDWVVVLASHGSSISVLISTVAVNVETLLKEGERSPFISLTYMVREVDLCQEGEHALQSHFMKRGFLCKRRW